MIARIRGQIVDTGDGYVVIEAGGIGYQVRVPDPLTTEFSPGEEKILYTELIVRQDALQIYGFPSPSQVELFRKLISVSHIGPQTALVLLSRLTPEEICDAITGQKPEILSKVPGLGKKGAERIILELKNKLPVIQGISSPGTVSSSPVQDAILALISLGYSQDEAGKAVQQVTAEPFPESSPELVREALRNLRKK
ncbi:MAG: Holliday junction branch migration protein RuvA [Methanospirillum sp.]|nr:Holliday junction branch migration protein RuvA [Methanospirillum sp.]